MILCELLKLLCYHSVQPDDFPRSRLSAHPHKATCIFSIVENERANRSVAVNVINIALNVTALSSGLHVDQGHSLTRMNGRLDLHMLWLMA